MAHNISLAKLSSRCDIKYLSDDLLHQIFIRVPLRSIVACKCVSNGWLALISSPNFIKQFTSHQYSLLKSILIFVTPHELILAFSQQNQPLEIPIPSPLDMIIKGTGSICGCSNGLFLCSKNRDTCATGCYVYDPLVKECIHIPDLWARRENRYAVGFVCKPKQMVSNRYWDQRDFHVVIIETTCVERMFDIKVDIFSSKKGQWEHIFMYFLDSFTFCPHRLLSCSYSGGLYFMGKTNIFVFNPYTTGRYTIDYPLEVDSTNITSFGFLGISCGSLRIADIRQNDLRVWKLVGKNHWDLVHRIDLSTKLPQKFCANYQKSVGGFHPYDGDIVYLHSYAEGVFVCNLRDEKFEVVPGYEKTNLSPFQLEISDLVLPQESRVITIN